VGLFKFIPFTLKTIHLVCCYQFLLFSGAIGSPQLLQLSGVGDPVHLAQVGVKPVVDLPQVGLNLQDHLVSQVSVSFSANNAALDFWDMVSPVYLYQYGN